MALSNKAQRLANRNANKARLSAERRLQVARARSASAKKAVTSAKKAVKKVVRRSRLTRTDRRALQPYFKERGIARKSDSRAPCRRPLLRKRGRPITACDPGLERRSYIYGPKTSTPKCYSRCRKTVKRRRVRK